LGKEKENSANNEEEKTGQRGGEKEGRKRGVILGHMGPVGIPKRRCRSNRPQGEEAERKKAGGNAKEAT